jgi:hypothetical protein
MRRCAFPSRTSGIAAGPFSQTLLINSRQFPGGDAPELALGKVDDGVSLRPCASSASWLVRWPRILFDYQPR